MQNVQKDVRAAAQQSGDDRRKRSANSRATPGTRLPAWHRPRRARRTPDHWSHPKKNAQSVEACLKAQTLARLPAPPDDVIEADELCLRKTPALWVWLLISRLTRQVLGFALGDHSDGLLEAAWRGVPTDYRDQPVCTDHWDAYARFFADTQHTACDKGSGLTSIVEGLNTKWRQRQSGMVRRSCGVHVNIADDIFERFLLLLDSHNVRCEQKWRRKQTEISTTLLNP